MARAGRSVIDGSRNLSHLAGWAPRVPASSNTTQQKLRSARLVAQRLGEELRAFAVGVGGGDRWGSY